MVNIQAGRCPVPNNNNPTHFNVIHSLQAPTDLMDRSCFRICLLFQEVKLICPSAPLCPSVRPPVVLSHDTLMLMRHHHTRASYQHAMGKHVVQGEL